MEGMSEIELLIRGMTCASCAARVEKKLNRIGDVRATVNFATERASVAAPPSVTAGMLIEKVHEAGYAAELIPAAQEGGPPEPDDARAAYLRRRLFLALIFYVPLTD